MSKPAHEEITRDEIKKEFQLERMILFSDAVFAIVITLMAIEIKLPETEGGITIESLPEILKHLAPTILAYCASFIFIGVVWYQHLLTFSLLKDYDKGLVLRNLLLLFFIGLFPFCATVIARAKGSMIALFMYMGIILMCIISQYVLQHYILVKRPALRVNANVEKHLVELRKRKISLIGFSLTLVLVVITYFLITDPLMKPLANLWMILFPISYKILTKKM